jgi:hypothetical protein
MIQPFVQELYHFLCFRFCPLVAKPRLGLDRNLVCELLLPSGTYVQSFRSIPPAVAKRALQTDDNNGRYMIALTFTRLYEQSTKNPFCIVHIWIMFHQSEQIHVEQQLSSGRKKHFLQTLWTLGKQFFSKNVAEIKLLTNHLCQHCLLGLTTCVSGQRAHHSRPVRINIFVQFILFRRTLWSVNAI